MTDEPIQNLGKRCLYPCKLKAGRCNWCGSQGYCCARYAPNGHFFLVKKCE